MGSVPRNRLGIASGLLALMRTLGQTSGLPLMGTLFALQVRAAANLPPNFEVTQADPQALLIGLRGTYQIAAFVILIATLLAVLALWLDAQRRKQAAYSVVSGEQKTCH